MHRNNVSDAGIRQVSFTISKSRQILARVGASTSDDWLLIPMVRSDLELEWKSEVVQGARNYLIYINSSRHRPPRFTCEK